MGCWVLQYIVIPLVSALIGGGLTLVGVRATIKHGDKIRNDDHEWEMKIHAKPILIISLQNNTPLPMPQHFCFLRLGIAAR